MIDLACRRAESSTPSGTYHVLSELHTGISLNRATSWPRVLFLLDPRELNFALNVGTAVKSHPWLAGIEVVP